MKAVMKGRNQETPSPFYAILLMDGDSLGELLRKSGSAVSDALDRFTRQVPDIVDRHNGFLIYAGGDDVLALLPLEDALACAAAVRQCYLDAFRPRLGPGKAPPRSRRRWNTPTSSCR